MLICDPETIKKDVKPPLQWIGSNQSIHAFIDVRAARSKKFIKKRASHCGTFGTYSSTCILTSENDVAARF